MTQPSRLLAAVALATAVIVGPPRVAFASGDAAGLGTQPGQGVAGRPGQAVRNGRSGGAEAYARLVLAWLPACIGDCSRDGAVTVEEILVLVTLALGGAAPPACPGGVPEGAEVNVDLIIQAVANAVSACPPDHTPTPAATRTPTPSPTPQFADNRDGTITDGLTGLMWEKKVRLDRARDDANLNDADNTYPWAGQCTGRYKYCQPTRDAARACAASVEGDPTGCAECAEGEGTCSRGSTAWTWLVALNAARFGTHDDWRMPTTRELRSLVEYGEHGRLTPPTINDAFHGASCGPTCGDPTNPACACTDVGYYWSATTLERSAIHAWVGSFSSGSAYASGKDEYVRVRAVRDVVPISRTPTPTPTTTPQIYVDNRDGTITGVRTGLTWEKKIKLDGTKHEANLQDADNTYPWAGTCSGADKYCQPTAAAAAACAAGVEGDAAGCERCAGNEGTCSAPSTVWTWLVALNAASYAAYDDWRLPRFAELYGLIEVRRLPAIDGAFHGAQCGAMCADVTDPACACTVVDGYWSSTTAARYPARAVYVHFLGPATDGDKQHARRVRAVRDGR